MPHDINNIASNCVGDDMQFITLVRLDNDGILFSSLTPHQRTYALLLRWIQTVVLVIL